MSHRIAKLTALTPLFTLLIIRILQSCTITAPDPITDNKADQVTLQIYFGQNILLHDLPDYANPEIPDYIPLPDPSIADITDIGATLGRVLFYDKQLSVDNSISCSSCHKQELAFSDVNIASVGVDGTTGRHSMRLVNALYGEDQQFFWDERASSLEDQSTQPIQDHIEMGFSGVDGAPGIQDLISKMEQIPYYPILFDRTFNSEEITEERMQMALAQFIRSIHSFDSRYDEGRGQVGNHIQPFPNFTQEENDGKLLFTTPPVFDPQSRRIDGGLGCAGCHRPPVFDIDPNSLNNAMIHQISGMGQDLTNTRSPSLRDLLGADGSANGPFMHSGFSTEFIDVLAHYNMIGMQMMNNNMDPRLRPGGRPQRLMITQSEAAAVEAFILTLTGENLYSDPKWSNPFVGVAAAK